MSMIERALSVRPGLGDSAPGRVRPTSARGEWWQGWFVPARGLRPQLVDVLVALVIAVFQVSGTMSFSRHEPSPWALDAFAYALLVVGPVALLFRRRWPEATLVIALAAAAGYAASGYPRGHAGVPAFGFAVVSAIMMGRRAFAWGVLGVGFLALISLLTLIPDSVGQTRSVTGALAANLAGLPLAAAAAEIARSRLERRAERADAAREAARRRAIEERLLIARELHDVLAHNISLINVQSGVALHLLDQRPEHARPALEAINEASEAAFGELRSVLDVLTGGLGEVEAQGEEGVSAPRAPTAGVRDLDGLIGRTRAAGLDVRSAVEGDAWQLPAAVDLAAFRVVQEALTNVVRHAGSDARASVRLVYGPAELVVQIDDDGTQAGGSGDSATVGRGIAGMRERVHVLGGTFAAGPRPGRGFRVRARFPRQDGDR